MDDSLVVDINQPASNLLELPRGIIRSRDGKLVGVGPYKLEPIRFPVHLNKISDGPIWHPFRYHCESVFVCHNTQKR